MEQYDELLDGLFQALADPTRRAVLERLGTGAASITELADPFEMALPSFMKHIHFLEESGWIRTLKQGRVRTCTLEREPFASVERWLSVQRALRDESADRPQQSVPRAQRSESRNDPAYESKAIQRRTPGERPKFVD